MDWWTNLKEAFDLFLEQYGLIAAFTVLLVEEAGLPVPIPGDFLMLLLGIQAREGLVPLWLAIVAMEVATVVGATVLYALSRLAGRSMVYRYGRYVRLTPERLDKAEKWISERGFWAVFLGRLVPGLRIVTAVACGIFGIPAKVFIPAMALGALLYITAYTLLGYFLGPPVLALIEQFHLPLGLLWTVLPLALLFWWTYRARLGLRLGGGTERATDRPSRIRAGAIAGALATLGCTSVLNIVVNAAGDFVLQAPGALVDQTAARISHWLARDAQPHVFLIAIPAYVAVGVLWGIVYALFAEERLKVQDGYRGVLFAFAPFVVSVGFILPLIGLGVIGTGAVGPVAFGSEAIRHLAYGAILGLVYPVLLARKKAREHPVRVLPHPGDEMTEPISELPAVPPVAETASPPATPRTL